LAALVSERPAFIGELDLFCLFVGDVEEEDALVEDEDVLRISSDRTAFLFGMVFYALLI